jgi:hypothetical protein
MSGNRGSASLLQEPLNEKHMESSLCSSLSSYRGDPEVLFAACCPGSLPQTAASADMTDCPSLAGVPASVHRLSENLVTCTYSPSPLWNAASLDEGSVARAQVCDFLRGTAQASSGHRTLVHLSGETSSAPAFLARWRAYETGPEGSLPEMARTSPAEYASCETAADALGPAYERFLAARIRAEAGRLLPGLANEVREFPLTYAQHFASPGWPRKVSEWQSRLDAELNAAAVSLRGARSAAVSACFPKAPMGADPTTHLGAYGQTMVELLTAGLDAAATARDETMSGEDPSLNAEGVVMCASLPGRMLGSLESFWSSPETLRGCYANVTTADAMKLRGLLEGPNPRVLDAFRLVRSWKAGEGCEERVATLHRALHNLAVFYHASPLLASMADLPASCRMTEAERADPLDRPLVPGARSFPGPFQPCAVGVSDLCGSLPNTLAATPGALGHGALRAMVTPGVLEGRMLSVKDAPPQDNELNVALARAMAARKNLICEVNQWAGVRTEDGVITEAPNFCRRDLTSPWLFSEDPGRGNCNRARAMLRDTPLESTLAEYPRANAPYCGDAVDAADPDRFGDACCCGVKEYTDQQICLLPGAP